MPPEPPLPAGSGVVVGSGAAVEVVPVEDSDVEAVVDSDVVAVVDSEEDAVVCSEEAVVCSLDVAEDSVCEDSGGVGRTFPPPLFVPPSSPCSYESPLP
jgi:hypothetical protein